MLTGPSGGKRTDKKSGGHTKERLEESRGQKLGGTSNSSRLVSGDGAAGGTGGARPKMSSGQDLADVHGQEKTTTHSKHQRDVKPKSHTVNPDSEDDSKPNSDHLDANTEGVAHEEQLKKQGSANDLISAGQVKDDDCRKVGQSRAKDDGPPGVHNSKNC